MSEDYTDFAVLMNTFTPVSLCINRQILLTQAGVEGLPSRGIFFLTLQNQILCGIFKADLTQSSYASSLAISTHIGRNLPRLGKVMFTKCQSFPIAI